MKKLAAVLLSVLFVMALSGLCLAQDDQAPAPATDDAAGGAVIQSGDQAPAAGGETATPETPKTEDAAPSAPDLK